MTTHLRWETINDLVDGVLTADARADATTHLEACASCAAERDALQAILREAHDVPRDVTAPALAWNAIALRIDRTKTVALRAAGGEERHGFRVSRRRLVAAAVLLVAASSALTTMIVRRAPTAAVIAANDAGTTEANASVTSDVALIEREYLSTATQLRSTLELERAGLAPSTIAIVERSLALIDDAIAEARQALLADPANGALRELLRKNHQQKIDFLRRSTALLQKA